jgi:hypothetical protein
MSPVTTRAYVFKIMGPLLNPPQEQTKMLLGLSPKQPLSIAHTRSLENMF